MKTKPAGDENSSLPKISRRCTFPNSYKIAVCPFLRNSEIILSRVNFNSACSLNNNKPCKRDSTLQMGCNFYLSSTHPLGRCFSKVGQKRRKTERNSFSPAHNFRAFFNVCLGVSHSPKGVTGVKIGSFTKKGGEWVAVAKLSGSKCLPDLQTYALWSHVSCSIYTGLMTKSPYQFDGGYVP